jgi:hypothetical protein
MTYDETAGVFARREDADWAIFCRAGGGDEADRQPVPLEPGDEAAAGESPAVRHFQSRVVGIPYPNADGTSRREAVLGLRRWELVRLAHRPDNPVDRNAVAVLRVPDGRQLGYLPAAAAAEVVAAARAGTRYLALVGEVTGARDDLLSIGQPVRAEVVVLALERGATRSMARRYVLDLMNRA